MEIFTILNLITLALASHASLLQAQENLPNQEETFKQLCVAEYKAKLEHDKCVGLDTEDDLFEHYKELMDSRILLGSKLGIHFCPPELIKKILVTPDYRMEQIWLAYDEKCQAEMRAATLCSKFSEARQLSSDEISAEELKQRERSACLDYKSAMKGRKLYAKNHLILKPCDAELRRNSREMAEAEVDKWLNSRPKPIFKPEKVAPIHYKDDYKELPVANEQNKDKTSSKSKNKFSPFSCFRKPDVKS